MQPPRESTHDALLVGNVLLQSVKSAQSFSRQNPGPTRLNEAGGEVEAACTGNAHGCVTHITVLPEHGRMLVLVWLVGRAKAGVRGFVETWIGGGVKHTAGFDRGAQPHTARRVQGRVALGTTGQRALLDGVVGVAAHSRSSVPSPNPPVQPPVWYCPFGHATQALHGPFNDSSVAVKSFSLARLHATAPTGAYA